MLTLLVAVGAFVGYILAYHTYGRWLSRKIFHVDPNAEVPAKQLRDDIDFVPTKKGVIFGHHFTSIAGTGPIVGPAVAVFWGWLPALLWVLFGSIFIGAVHDFGSLIVSLRNRGQTVGEIAGRLINPRARTLFLLILFFALMLVLAIFGLVIAQVFAMYPETVFPIWIQIPIAVGVGVWVYRRGGGLLWPSLLALAFMWGTLAIGVYYLPIDVKAFGLSNPVIFWTVLLLIYCFIASVLPVWTLLQPRDFINSHLLVMTLVMLMVGVGIAAFTGKADLNSAPMVAENIPAGGPPIWPFLFITIACGAVSGFHCLVSSGTSSKQVESEMDAQYVGYGAMLLEGGLAVLVILACCAGLGMGVEKLTVNGTVKFLPAAGVEGDVMTGTTAWSTVYDASKGWGGFKLGDQVNAFVMGSANFLHQLGLPLKFCIGIIAVLVASFAATTLDTATRLQRYVIQELSGQMKIKAFQNKYAATGLAIVLAGAIAMLPGPGTAGKPGAYGTGGLLLWPLFGAMNQLLAGLAFMVVVFYLWRRKKPVWFAVVPMIGMLILPFWALLWQIFNSGSGFIWPLVAMVNGQAAWGWDKNHLLLFFGLVTIALQIWMIVEGFLIWPRVQGVLEEALPPLAPRKSVLAVPSRN